MQNQKPLAEFSHYVSLSVFGMIAMSCYILADTFFVAQGLGTNGLAALNLAVPAYNFIHGLGLMLGMGGATKFSIYKSQGEEKNSNSIYTHTLYLSAFFSLIFMAMGLFCSEPLARLLGADAAVFEMTNTYLKVMLLFAPAFILNDVFLCFVRNDGNPRLSMIATVSSSLFNIVFDYVFIFPCGMGIFGAILATGLAPVVGVVVMAPHWMRKQKGFHLIRTRIQAGMIGANLSLGFPSLLAQLSSGIVMITFNSLILPLEGNTGVAAYGVIANISLVVLSVYTGIAQGAQPLVSQAYGQNRPKAVVQFLRYSMLSMLAFSLVVYVILFVFADPIARIFNAENSAALQEIAVTGLKLYFISIPFAGFNIVLSTHFTSIERAIPAHILSLLRSLALVLPMAIVLSALWGMTGIWLTLPVTELVVAALGLILYKKPSKGLKNQYT